MLSFSFSPVPLPFSFLHLSPVKYYFILCWKEGEVPVCGNRFLSIHGLVLKCKFQHSNLFLICSWMSWTKRQKVFPKSDVKLPETYIVPFFIIKRETVLILFYHLFSFCWTYSLYINKLPFSLNDAFMSGYSDAVLIIIRKKFQRLKHNKLLICLLNLWKMEKPFISCQISHKSFFWSSFFPAASPAKCTI